MNDLSPIVEMRSVNLKRWIMNQETGILEFVVVRHVFEYRRENWDANHWELLPVEEREDENE